MNTYHRFAEVYDRVGQSTPAEILKAGYLNDLLARHDWHGQRVLDAGCGTGTLAIWLAQQGYDVTAVDASAAMVAAARDKAQQAAQDGGIRWLVHDLRTAHLPEGHDLAIALNAVLSHILEGDELAAALRGIAAATAPGGVFLFELPTHHAMAHVWANNRVAEVHGDMAWVWQHVWDEQARRSTTYLHHFLALPDQPHLYERFDEVHVHRAYERAEVEPLLAAAGFALLEVVGFGTLEPPQPDSTEVIYIARRVV